MTDDLIRRLALLFFVGVVAFVLGVVTGLVIL